eukprot:7037630-Prorocentrum_lima.AAC.1
MFLPLGDELQSFDAVDALGTFPGRCRGLLPGPSQHQNETNCHQCFAQASPPGAITQLSRLSRAVQAIES